MGKPDEVEAWAASYATFVEFTDSPGHRRAVMRDPEGNELGLHRTEAEHSEPGETNPARRTR